jgi:hypothetical protein
MNMTGYKVIDFKGMSLETATQAAGVTIKGIANEIGTANKIIVINNIIFEGKTLKPMVANFTPTAPYVASVQLGTNSAIVSITSDDVVKVSF